MCPAFDAGTTDRPLRRFRSHLASELHQLVADLLCREVTLAADLAAVAAWLADQGHDLPMSRDLDLAKAYQQAAAA
jgi:hypothetical protein